MQPRRDLRAAEAPSPSGGGGGKTNMFPMNKFGFHCTAELWVQEEEEKQTLMGPRESEALTEEMQVQEYVMCARCVCRHANTRRGRAAISSPALCVMNCRRSRLCVLAGQACPWTARRLADWFMWNTSKRQLDIEFYRRPKCYGSLS